ncbi:Galactose-inhibitable lectin 35 kDa subunit [Entamoeba marina]
MTLLLFGILCCNTFANYLTSDYNTYPEPTDNPTELSGILYERAKCTTCCRVIFASDWNYQTGKAFTTQNDKDGHTRFVMDMEFDDVEQVRKAQGDYEQCVLLRPLNMGNQLQYWEFAPYKMYTSYPIPKRVHDIRSGAAVNRRLIIWKKKAPLLASTNNQRFVYVHPYSTYPTGTVYSDLPYHFYLPYYTSSRLCYEACTGDDWDYWTGNRGLTYSSAVHQIKAAICADDAKQKFVPVFA